MSSLQKCLFMSSAHFFDLVVFLILSCISCSDTADITFSAASFANIFSQVAFVLLMVSFAVQKLLSLIRPYLFLLSFLLPWETDPRKYCYDL